MISRVADHCFWFGRYIERAEATARTLSASRSLALDGELPDGHVWRPVVVVSGEEDEFKTRLAGGQADHPAWADGEIVQRFMVWDEDNGVSLARSINGMRWNARSAREVISLEAWEVVNDLRLWIRGDASPAIYAHQREAFYHQVRRSTQLTFGLLHSTMLHDEPLAFIWLGAMLERVNQTARILDVHHHAFTNLVRRPGDDVIETALWLSLLHTLSGGEAFLKRSRGKISSGEVARFLVAESAFPRSIAYGIRAAHGRLVHLRPPDRTALPGARTYERLRALDVWVTERGAEAMPGSELHAVLTHVVDEVHEICVLLGKELLGG